MSQISKNSMSIGHQISGTGSAMVNPTSTPPPHLYLQQHAPNQHRRGMMVNSMSPPSSVPPSTQQQSPHHYNNQHNLYNVTQPPMMPNNYSNASPNPLHSPSVPHRHPIVASRNNFHQRPHPIVAQHNNYPRHKPARQPRFDKDRVTQSQGGGSGEPAREPLKDVIVLSQAQTTNIKEKTPLCLINELARYNKVNVQYVLEDEQGPAHRKTFYMKLKLGDEEYSGSAASIRKAQHQVATLALEKTQLKQPVKDDRPGKPTRGKGSGHAMTVELNSLLMKRGEEAVYSPMTPRQKSFIGHPNFNYRGSYNYGRMPVLHNVSLKIGPREFVGFGPTPKAAKNHAADKALRILKRLPMPVAEKKECDANEDLVAENGTGDSQVKSAISLLHEIALKRDLHISFEVCMMREIGPAHTKMFTTQCIMGDLMCESEGQSKKESKKMAAEKMLAKLREAGPLPVSEIVIPGSTSNTKQRKTKNLIKTQKGNQNYGIDINPISRLIQVMQAQKKKEPEYSLVGERGFPTRREFIIQVLCDGKTCNGIAQNKKLAKRNAAEAMLNLLGLNHPSPVPGKPALKSVSSSAGLETTSSDKKVSFVENNTKAIPDGMDEGEPGVQSVPGLIKLPESGRKVKPYIRGRIPGIVDATDLGGRRLASGDDGGTAVATMPMQLQQELSRMTVSHNIDLSFNNIHTEGATPVLNPRGIASDHSVTMYSNLTTSEKIKQGPLTGKN